MVLFATAVFVAFPIFNSWNMMLVKNSNEVGLFFAAGASQVVEAGTFLLLTLMPKITKLATEL